MPSLSTTADHWGHSQLGAGPQLLAALTDSLAELEGLYSSLGIAPQLLEAAARAAVADDGESRTVTQHMQTGAVAYAGSGGGGAGAMPAAQAVTNRRPSAAPAPAPGPAPSLGSTTLQSSNAPRLVSGSSSGVFAPRRQAADEPERPVRPDLSASGPGRPGLSTHIAGKFVGTSSLNGAGSSLVSPPRLSKPEAYGHARPSLPIHVAPAVSHITLADLTSPPPKQLGLGSRQPEETWPAVNEALAAAPATVSNRDTGEIPQQPVSQYPVELQQLMAAVAKLQASVPVPAEHAVQFDARARTIEQQKVLLSDHSAEAKPAAQVGPFLSIVPAQHVQANRHGLFSAARLRSPPVKVHRASGMKLLGAALESASAENMHDAGNGLTAVHACHVPSRQSLALDITILPTASQHVLSSSGLQLDSGGNRHLSAAQLFERDQRRTVLSAEISVASVQARDVQGAAPSSPGTIKVGSIEVRRCDTGIEAGFALAHRFVSKHASSGIGPEHVARIAKSITRALDSALEAERVSEDASRRRAGAELAESFRGKTTVQQPFELSTEALADARTKAAADSTVPAEMLPPPPSFAAQQLLPPPPPLTTSAVSFSQSAVCTVPVVNSSSASVTGQKGALQAQPEMKTVNLNARRGRLLGKLHLEVAPGRTGVIAIRSGDVPKTLVSSFAKAYGLRDSAMLEGVLAAVERKIGTARSQVAQSAASADVLSESAQMHVENVLPAGSGAPFQEVLGTSTAAHMRSLTPLPQVSTSRRGSLSEPASPYRVASLLSQAPNRSPVAIGPFGAKVAVQLSPDASLRPTTLGRKQHINMWFDDAPPALSGHATSINRALSRHGSEAGVTVSKQDIQPIMQASNRPQSRVRGRSRYVRPGAGVVEKKEVLRRSVSAGPKETAPVQSSRPETVIIVHSEQDANAVWGHVPSNARSTSRSSSAAARDAAIVEVLGGVSQDARQRSKASSFVAAVSQSQPALIRFDPLLTVAPTFVAASSRPTSRRNSGISAIGPGPAATVMSSTESSSRRASVVQTQMATKEGHASKTDNHANRRRSLSSTASINIKGADRGNSALRANASSNSISAAPAPEEEQAVIVVRRRDVLPSAALSVVPLVTAPPPPVPVLPRTGSKFEGLVPGPTSPPGQAQAYVTALTMREGLRRDAFDRVLRGEAPGGAIPVPIVLNSGTSAPMLDSPSDLSSPGKGQLDSSFSAGRSPLQSMRFPSSPGDEEEDLVGESLLGSDNGIDDDDEGGSMMARERLTDAQRRLLDATLTPGAVKAAARTNVVDVPMKTAEQLQAGLSYLLPPPPPPPRSRKSSRSSSLDSTELLEEGRQTREVAERAVDAPATRPLPIVNGSSSGKELGTALFNLDVDIGGGRKGRIVVHAGVEVDVLAEEFITAHRLPPAVMPRLHTLIQSAIRAQEAKAGHAA